jgi:hypothetical protein
MFRRKRYPAQASDIPWWPSEAPADPGNPDPGHAGYGYPGPAGDLPPLAAHDPFGGWPAFTGDGDGIDGASGHPHPATGWPLVESYAEPDQAFADPGGDEQPGPPEYAHEHPPGPQPFPQAGGYPAEPSAPVGPGADEDGAATDWLPLLTHPVGGQRFQPDAEATEVDPAAAEQPDRPRNGHNRETHRPAGDHPDDTGEADDHGDADGLPGADDRSATNDSPSADGSPDTDDGRAAPTAEQDGSHAGVVTWLDPVAVPDPAEASALAGAFAADYLSWDQDNPDRRGQILAQYLPADLTGDASLLGWSGKGRQRSEFVLPGVVQPDGDERVMVDVRVRVTPFRQVGETGQNSVANAGELEVAGVPAVAPAPTARGWKGLDSHWVRLTVPVTRERGRLVVDIWDEQLGDEDLAEEAGLPSTDPTTADDSFEERT